MSNLLFNLRVVYWHLQISRDAPYVWISFNSYHAKRGLQWPFVELY